MDDQLRIVPANEASFEDVQTVLGERGYAARCQCQKFHLSGREHHLRLVPLDELRFRLREQTDCGYPDSDVTAGLVAHLGEEPVGWCRVEPRRELRSLGQTPWRGRDEDRDEDGVWAAVCFVTRTGFRHRGVSHALTAATVPFARERGATALEGYPMDPVAGKDVTWGEMHVGKLSSFLAAGFRVVSRPSARRAVVRVDY